MSEALKFDDLSLSKAAFEVRYDNAFLLWDRSGSIWTQIILKQPELRVARAEPSKVVFASRGERELQLTLELGRLGVIAINPDKKLSAFTELVTRFTEITTQTLQVQAYTRVGLRVSFFKEYVDREAAAEALLGTRMIQVPAGQHFGLSTPILEPEVSIRKEDGKNGFSLRLKAEAVKFEFEPNFGLSEFAKPQSLEKHRVHLDVDCYLQAPVAPSKFYVSDWVDQTLHVIKRDGRKVFGE